MGSALVALATTTLASSSATVSFSSISGSYRDLRLVISGTSTGNATAGLQFNSDTGSNYSYVEAYGTGSAAGSISGTTTYARLEAMYTGDTNKIIDIMDYSATDKHKTVLVRSNTPATEVHMLADRWANTAAITSITVTIVSNSYATGTTFSLFGVSA